ncbi:hypothetical protein EXIGLDRAFT_286252 [Exidia glandulosa HHB12029]|uniref:Uncharacterized protein n=1 Tax=Exidia glandulosa HHB12029 TaxID=1314781 RepID=A0A165M565_EXIGL|nr:hypothetical protein EXIGLDRAFT_286252 [Exidia glandulosa HHB12029]
MTIARTTPISFARVAPPAPQFVFYAQTLVLSTTEDLLSRRFFRHNVSVRMAEEGRESRPGVMISVPRLTAFPGVLARSAAAGALRAREKLIRNRGAVRAECQAGARWSQHDELRARIRETFRLQQLPLNTSSVPNPTLHTAVPCWGSARAISAGTVRHRWALEPRRRNGLVNAKPQLKHPRAEELVISQARVTRCWVMGLNTHYTESAAVCAHYNRDDRDSAGRASPARLSAKRVLGGLLQVEANLQSAVSGHVNLPGYSRLTFILGQAAMK